MNKHASNDLTVIAARHAQRARLRKLLFTGAALGTALMMLGASETKLPPYHGE
jgi:hypothetical protein